MKHGGMKENLKLQKLSREELETLPKVKVVVTYTPKQLKNEIIATIVLDDLLKLEFPLSDKDIMLLQQEHKLTTFGRKQVFEKQYHLLKGFDHKGTIKERRWFRVDLLIVPSIIVKKFLCNKEKYYVQQSEKLNALFHEYV